MDSFPISDLQRFSGIKAHTIRVWEQRYQTLTPQRSEGNTRYYSGDQLRRLLNIVSLLNAGHKIAELSALNDKQLSRLIQNSSRHQTSPSANITHEFFISQMIVAAMGFDEAYLEKLFASCILRFGLNTTYQSVMYPALVRVGLMWSCNTLPPAQEHFISHFFRQKLWVAIDALPPAVADSDTWLLFLPEDEYHETGLLFANYLIRQAGQKVLYLGPGTSFSAVENTVSAVDPQRLLLFLVHYDDPALTQAYVDRLSGTFPSVNIHLAGNEKLLSTLRINGNVQGTNSIHDLEQVLRSPFNFIN